MPSLIIRNRNSNLASELVGSAGLQGVLQVLGTNYLNSENLQVKPHQPHDYVIIFGPYLV